MTEDKVLEVEEVSEQKCKQVVTVTLYNTEGRPPPGLVCRACVLYGDYCTVYKDWRIASAAVRSRIGTSTFWGIAM